MTLLDRLAVATQRLTHYGIHVTTSGYMIIAIANITAGPGLILASIAGWLCLIVGFTLVCRHRASRCTHCHTLWNEDMRRMARLSLLARRRHTAQSHLVWLAATVGLVASFFPVAIDLARAASPSAANWVISAAVAGFCCVEDNYHRRLYPWCRWCVTQSRHAAQRDMQRAADQFAHLAEPRKDPS